MLTPAYIYDVHMNVWALMAAVFHLNILFICKITILGSQSLYHHIEKLQAKIYVQVIDRDINRPDVIFPN